MRIDIITVLPELMESPLSASIMQRAQEKNKVQIHYHQLRDYSQKKSRSVDDYQFGGGAGMVIQCEPLAACIDNLLSHRKYDDIIYMTPDGKTLNQSMSNQLSLNENIMIICGHYKGIDQRIRDVYVTREISIGDFVLSGGELAACVLIDAVVRLLPGVLNDESSALTDSFQDDLLAPPVYSRPADWRGHKVPEVLLSGHFDNIEEWRYEQALERTKRLRPDLLKYEEEE
ncbi:MAG: tRNA (guanosine(37)-N1)-methyltransferase TrmD [Flavobacteriales bacterium]